MLPTEQLVAMVKLLVAAVAVMVVSTGSTEAAETRIEATAEPHRVQIGHPPDGRAGNTERVRWALRDRHGRSIGVGLLRCQWFHANERVCSGVLKIGAGDRRGTITVQGLSATRSLGVWAVTGGTGLYRNWDGELRFTATGFGKLTVVITR